MTDPDGKSDSVSCSVRVAVAVAFEGEDVPDSEDVQLSVAGDENDSVQVRAVAEMLTDPVSPRVTVPSDAVLVRV